MLSLTVDDGDRFLVAEGVYGQCQVEQDGALTIHDFHVIEDRRRGGLGRAALCLARAHFTSIRANGVEMDQVGGVFWTQMGREGLIDVITPVYGAADILFPVAAAT